MMFERFHSRYDLRGYLLTETGLHIGAGGSLTVVGSDNPIVRDINGLPYIPGSSFKGVLRSLVEALVRAISPEGDNRQEPRACDPLDQGKWCIPPRPQMEEWQMQVQNNQMTQQELDARIWKESCTVCRLFGSPWLASKVKVQDLYLAEGASWIGRVEVRDGVAIDRDTETVSGGRKYDFEVVPRGTKFSLRIRADNASAEELGLLFLGLREFSNGGVWVGGNTSRGLGRVRVDWDEFELVEGRDGLLDYLRSGKGRVISKQELNTFINDKIRTFLNIVKKEG
jgi:CRISPR-associated RAMP protein (TIGR02581 family)